jgi:hypothetical protein
MNGSRMQNVGRNKTVIFKDITLTSLEVDNKIPLFFFDKLSFNYPGLNGMIFILDECLGSNLQFLGPVTIRM